MSKSSYLPDQKSVCEQYGIYNTDLQPRTRRKVYKKDRNQSSKGYYKYFPRSHFYEPKDIHLKTQKAEAKQQLKCWVCGKEGHTAFYCPDNEAARKGRGKLSEQRAAEYRRRAEEKKKVRFGCNRCGSSDHDTNQCPQSPFTPPKIEAHPVLEQVSEYFGDASSSSSSSDELVVNNTCSCPNSLQCACTDSDSSSSVSSSPSVQKLKLCMHNLAGDSEAEMLAQIKGMPEGEMKKALLDAYVKIVKGKEVSQRKPPLFLEASYERNTKSYMKFNREQKPQALTLTDLAANLSEIKKEVQSLKSQVNKLQDEIDHSYPVDHWARQEIMALRAKIDHIPLPLEDAEYEQAEASKPAESALEAFSNMQVLTISYQKYYVQIRIEIQEEIFSLIALIDTGSDINLLHKDKIPAKYWMPSSGCVTGLGNHELTMQYEVPRANLIFDNISIGMKFHISDAPIECILGSSFLSMLTPHGSCTINDQPGYFFTIPACRDQPPRVIQLPFVSENYWQLGYLNCMIIVKCFNQETGRAE